MATAAKLIVKTSATGEVRVALRYVAAKQAGGARLSIAANSKTHHRRHQPSGLQSGFGGLPGVTVFTRLAASRIREAAAIVERDYGKRCLFITGTLPGSTVESMEALSRWSGYVVERLNQWLRDKDAVGEFFSVWERQTRGALHIHAVFASKDIFVLRKVERGFKAFWMALLSDVSDVAGVDMFERNNGTSWKGAIGVIRANAVPVRRSVRAYLSKYMSKNQIERNRWRKDLAGNAVYFPSRWWSMCNSLRDKVRDAQLQIESQVVPLAVAIDWYELATGDLVSKAVHAVWYHNPLFLGEKTVIGWHDKSDTTYLWKVVMDWWNVLRLSPECHAPRSNVLPFPKTAQSRYKGCGSMLARAARTLGFMPS